MSIMQPTFMDRALRIIADAESDVKADFPDAGPGWERDVFTSVLRLDGFTQAEIDEVLRGVL